MAIFARKHKTPLGIYVHIPFCKSKCAYCDFYSVKDASLADSYVDALCAHIREAGAASPLHLVDTIYFGGGTPSFFGGDRLNAVLATIRKSFDVARDAEITFEANPDSVTDKLLRKLRGEGFNRVSLGVQCDDDMILSQLGRPHNYAQAVEAVRKIRKHGFRNLSIDLMYGLPGQTVNAWKETLENVLKLAPEHISCYGLTLEANTPLAQNAENLELADDDVQADMYLYAVDYLAQKGYRQYEISNFCKKGNVSRHNLKYWQGGEYLGFGPDASSDFGGQRFSAVRDLRSYIAGIREGGQVLREVQDVPPRERAGEYLMMRLRTVSGIDPREYEKKYRLPFGPLEKALEVYRIRGLATCTYDGRWRFTPQGFLLSNDMISDLLAIQDKCKPLASKRR